MIDKIIDSISPTLTDIPWVERFGGIVRRATRIIGDSPETFVEQAFPVSASVTNKDCWENGKYADLVPDDKYKSLMYFEQRGPIVVKQGYQDGYISMSAPLTIVCWLNLPRLGFSQANESPIFEAEIIKKIYFKKFEVAALKISNGKFTIDALAARDENIFRKYTYSDKMGLLLYPYDFFAIDITAIWQQNVKCLQDVDISSPINCVDLR